MKKKPYRYFLYLLVRALMALTRILPRPVVLAMASWGGTLAYFLLPHYRRQAGQHLKQAFPGMLNISDRARIERRMFVHMAKTVVDWVKFSSALVEERMTWVHYQDEDIVRLKSILEAGRGMILVTAHIGNWEVMGGFIMAMGFKGCVVGRRIYYTPYNDLIIQLRKSWGIETMYRDDSPKHIFQALKENKIVGILPDQDVDSVDGIFVPFFDRPAHTPVAPTRLALSSEAPIVPVFLVREGERYRLIVEPEIWVKPLNDKQETLAYYTKLWTAAIERVIRRYPDQWVWIHDRWKTEPPRTAEVQTLVA